MDINTCNKYTLDSIQLEKPIKIEDFYVSSINYIIQTPKLNLEKISKKITIALDDKMENLLNEFDNKIISLISEKSQEFFEETLSLEDADDIYKHSFKNRKSNNNKMNLSINKKITIFNKYKENLNIDSLCENDTVICLIKCKKIFFYKSYCEPHWEVFQIKIKEPEIIKKDYLFVDDPNDVYIDDSNDNSELEDINHIKKINIKQ